MGTRARTWARWLLVASSGTALGCAQGSALHEGELPTDALPGADGYGSSEDPLEGGDDTGGGGDDVDAPTGDDAAGPSDGDPPEPSPDAGGALGPGDAGVSLDDGGADVDAGPIEAPESCADGLTDCGAGCVDLSSTESDCGSCGNACVPGRTCTAGACEPPAGCQAESFGGHDYLFCSTGATWAQARSNCLGWGMDLAIVDDVEEHLFIQERGLTWIGLSDLESEGSFFWVPAGDAGSTQGAPPGFTSWVPGEPNNQEECFLFVCNGVGEHCVELREDGWNDEDCGDAQAYVCES